MSKELETFLVLVHSSSSSFVQAFIKQCAWEELPLLNHDTVDVRVFLLQPDPAPGGQTNYGTQLQHVIDFHCVYEASELMKRAAFSLSRLPVQQRRLELERCMEVLNREMPPEVQPLSDEQIAKLSRWGEQPEFEPLPDEINEGD